jgi:S-DNA-T family DNA segregation ATPase FtsK/SpoIIIE
MSNRQKEIIGLILITFAVLSVISLFGHDLTENPIGIPTNYISSNYLGKFGLVISHYHYLILGYSSIIFPIIFAYIGYILFTKKNIKSSLRPIIFTLVVGIFYSTLMSFVANITGNENLNNYFSGIVGFAFSNLLFYFLGVIGSGSILFISFIVIITYLFKISIYDLFNKIYIFLADLVVKFISFFKIIGQKFIQLIKKKKNSVDIEYIEEDITEIENNPSDLNNDELEDNSNDKFSIAMPNEKQNELIIENNELDNSNLKELSKSDENNDSEIMIEEENQIISGDLDLEQQEQSKYFQYKLPQLNYLEDPIEIVKQDEDELYRKGQQLENALKTFGVDGEVKKVHTGPVISLFEIEPAIGVRVNKFINLSDDLARVMKAQRVRIIAPIPGSKSVGIELPNETLSIVYLKSILNSKKFIESKSKLTVALGKTTSGDAYVFDLCKMPHLLVAGATGAGKSVCINTIILSILYKAKPDEVKFILLDPKKLELSTYKSLVGYHLITSKNLDEYVMTTPENSVAILNSAIVEMERRFQVFADARVRNIEEYHIKQKTDSTIEKVPYIVVLIDELADLMMTSGRGIEEPITRLAQKARAVGIHLVVATQRPSVDVITGLIKSNFPSRISFLVSSKIDSRTILDQMGAEKLLGRGDLLFLLPGTGSPIRLHNAYVTLDEIEKIMNHISSQPKPDEIKLPEFEIKKNSSELSLADKDNQDEFLKDAANLVVDYQQASVSLLQRKFRIGYSRAGRLIDELESLGIVSAYNGSKAREILVDPSYLKEIFGEEE